MWFCYYLNRCNVRHTQTHTTTRTRRDIDRQTDRQTERQSDGQIDRDAGLTASGRAAQLLNEFVKQRRRCNNDDTPDV